MTYTIEYFYENANAWPFMAKVTILFGEQLPYYVSRQNNIWGDNLDTAYMFKRDEGYCVSKNISREKSWPEVEAAAQKALDKAIDYLAEAKAKYDADIEAKPATREGFIKIA